MSVKFDTIAFDDIVLLRFVVFGPLDALFIEWWKTLYSFVLILILTVLVRVLFNFIFDLN